MWIARDKTNTLWLYGEKPERNDECNCWMTMQSISIMEIDENLFPELTWEDEPLEVKITSSKLLAQFIEYVIDKYIDSVISYEFVTKKDVVNQIINDMEELDYVGCKK